MLKRLAIVTLLTLGGIAQAQQYFAAPEIVGQRGNNTNVIQGSAPSQQQTNQIEITAVGQQFAGTARYHTMNANSCSSANINSQQCWANIPSALYTALGGAATFTSCISWTQGTLTGGSSYTNGTYTNVPLTGGTGAGARGTVTVSGAAVTAVTFTVQSPGYAATDTLSATAASLGGTGSGFSIVINSISGTNGCTTSAPGFGTGQIPGGNSDRLFYNPGLHKQVVTLLGDSIGRQMIIGCCGSGFFNTFDGPFSNALMPDGAKTFQSNVTATSQFWNAAVMTRLWNVPWSRLLMVMGDVGWSYSTIPGRAAGNYTNDGQWLLNTQLYQYLTFANSQQAVFVLQIGTNDFTTPSTSGVANSTLTCTSNVVTVTTAAPHGIANAQGFTVTIAGVTPAGYNGTFTGALSQGGSTFTYPLTCPAAETVPGTWRANLYGSPTQGWPSLVGYAQTAINTIRANWPNANSSAGPYIVVMQPIARITDNTNVAGNNQSFVDYADYIAANMATLHVNVLIRWDSVAPLSPTGSSPWLNSICYTDQTTHLTPYCGQVYMWNRLKQALDRIQFGAGAVPLPANIFTVNGVWLTNHDLRHDNDNTPAFLAKVA